MFDRKVYFAEFINAAQKGKAAIISQYVNENMSDAAALNRTTDQGDTALICAATYGDYHAFHRLLVPGIDVNIANNSGKTALMMAAWNNCYPNILLDLVWQKANVDASDNEKFTALMFAASNGKTENVHHLIAAGASLDFVNKYGDSALILAAKHDHIDIVRLLLDAGADPLLVNNKGETAQKLARSHEMQTILDHAATQKEIENKVHLENEQQARQSEEALAISASNEKLLDEFAETIHIETERQITQALENERQFKLELAKAAFKLSMSQINLVTTSQVKIDNHDILLESLKCLSQALGVLSEKEVKLKASVASGNSGGLTLFSSGQVSNPAPVRVEPEENSAEKQILSPMAALR